MKNIANADRPKSVGAMLPPRPLRRSGKVAQTACNSDRREGKSCIPTLNQTFADSRILKISKFRTFRIAADPAAGAVYCSGEGEPDFGLRFAQICANVGDDRSRIRAKNQEAGALARRSGF